MHVAPGFVDLHTHYDAQVFWDPYCTLSGWHGVTSVAIGNCGFGFAPVQPELREYAMRSMTRVEAIPYESMRQGLPWDWVTFPEFLDSLDATPKALNMLPYVPAGPMLVDVLGLDDAKAGRLPTDDEHARLAAMLDEAMDAGGCGWSAQRLPPTGPAAVQRDWDGTPMPTDVMHDETCRVLARVLARRNQGVQQVTLTTERHPPRHRPPRGDRHAVRAAGPAQRRAGVRDAGPHVHRKAIEWLERCRERGIPVYGQGVTTDAGFTFTFEDWNLYDDSEAWMEATTGTLEERLHKLADPDRRQGLKDKLPSVATAPLETVTVLSPRSPSTEPYREMSVRQVADLTGKHPVDAMLDIAVDRPPAHAVLRRPAAGHVRPAEGDRAVPAHAVRRVRRRRPHEVPDRRSLPHRDARPAGPRQRVDHVRGGPPPAVRAAGPARRVPRPRPAAPRRSRRRRRVRPGAASSVGPNDVVEDLPGGEWRRVQKASGYHAVFVNGVRTIADDTQTERHPGRLLRHGRG